MPYTTLDQLKNKIDEAALIQLTDTANTGAIDATTVQRAIAAADALVDAYAGSVYLVPMDPVPPVAADLSATIAIALLHRFRSADSPVWNAAYRDAIEFLREVAARRATLEGAAEPSPAADLSANLSFTANPRRFSRQSLEGM
ncbi:MAG: DUF1320 domain-containing protein [Nitrospinae bacterium]|nr:DUF1320 domain-containing protein [Nitrospinota bacterium]